MDTNLKINANKLYKQLIQLILTDKVTIATIKDFYRWHSEENSDICNIEIDLAAYLKDMFASRIPFYMSWLIESEDCEGERRNALTAIIQLVISSTNWLYLAGKVMEAIPMGKSLSDA